MRTTIFHPLALIFINFVILSGLAWLSHDELETVVNRVSLKSQMLKVVGTVMLTLIGIFILRKDIRTSNKIPDIAIRASAILALSCIMYLPVVNKLYHNRIINGSSRAQVMKKAEDHGTNQFGGYAYTFNKLTLNEYKVLTRDSWYPSLPASSRDIDINYSLAEQFLPDRCYSIEYTVNLHEQIEEFEDKTDSSEFTQSSVVVSPTTKRVTLIFNRW